METKLQEAEKKTKERAITELSFESQVIYERLKKMEVNEFISYREVSDLIGRDVQKFRGPLHTARNILCREQIIFDVVVNDGLKRLPDEEIIHKQRKVSKHVRKVVRKSNRELSAVNYEKLSRSLQVEHNTLATHNGTLIYFSTPHNIKKIEQKVEEAQKRLPVGKTLDIFK